MTDKYVLRVFIFTVVLCSVCCIIACAGNSGKGEITVYQNSNLIENQSGMYDFELLYIGETSAEVEFRIKNDGDGTLSLTGTNKVDVIGNDSSCFIVNNTKTSSKIAPGVSTTFTLKLRSANAGMKTATISITNTDDDKNPYTFTVKGKVHPEYQWTKTFGCTKTENVAATEVDSMGNLYILGEFEFFVMFVPGDIKYCRGYTDIFLTKINENGTYAWTKQIGGRSSERGKDIAIDSNNNIYVLGIFGDEVDFGKDFGVTDIEKSAGGDDVFVTKMDSDGNYEWTHVFGNSEADVCIGIECDSNDNVYFACNFWGIVDIGAPFGVSDAKESAGVTISKIKSNGDYGWSKRITSNGNLMALDSNDNILIAGATSKNVNLGEDFGVSDYVANDSGSCFFVIKITADADYVLSKRIDYGKHSRIVGHSITLDSSNNIFISGYFNGIVDFGKGFGVSDVKTTTENDDPHNLYEYELDIFIMKINSDFSYGWIKQIGSEEGDERFCSIAIDKDEEIYIVSSLYREVDIGRDFGVTDIVKPISGFNTCFTKITADCTYCWTIKIGGPDGKPFNTQILVDSDNNIYIAGIFNVMVDFGMPFGATDLKKPDSSYPDVYIMKLKGSK